MAAPRNPSGRVIMGPQAAARTRTVNEAQRDYRAGKRADDRSPVLKWTSAPRNGLPPFKPYVYRGSDPLEGRML